LLRPLGAKFIERLAGMICTRGVDTQPTLILRFNSFRHGHAHDSPRRAILLHGRRVVEAKHVSGGRGLDALPRQFHPLRAPEQRQQDQDTLVRALAGVQAEMTANGPCRTFTRSPGLSPGRLASSTSPLRSRLRRSSMI
jgi:hypothetical protein